MNPKIFKKDDVKVFSSSEYNYMFNEKTGEFMRWGKTMEDDPCLSPFGPEIADIEVTTKCRGVGGKLCSFCYKANTPKGYNMSFKTFKKLFHNLPKTLTQIAFGADSQAESNPDLWKMMKYCRTNDYNFVVPNITVADITDETADKLAKYCGAVAVSRYDNKNYCYDSIKRLTDRGMTQINIHIMSSEETYDMVMETLRDAKTDPRLEKLNAIVLLNLKQKGRGEGFTALSQDKFNAMIEYAFEHDIMIGFDSCGAHKFLESVKDKPDFEQLEMQAEPCESGLFSFYANVKGHFFPCSFSEGEDEWVEGIDCTVEGMNFFKDLWYHEKTNRWRNSLLKCGRNCPLFKI